jgi:hypothetical protein
LKASKIARWYNRFWYDLALFTWVDIVFTNHFSPQH